MRILSALLFIVTSFAYAGDDLFVDCRNYCAFNEFENNCHGVAFVKEKNGKKDFLYTHYNKSMNSCVYFEFYTIPTFRKIKLSEVKTKCECGEPRGVLPDKNEPIKLETIKELLTLKTQLKSWTRCAPNPLTIPASNGEGHYTPEQLGVCQHMEAKGEDPYMVLGGCQEGTFWNYCHYHGNTNIFAGTLCAAGDRIACASIKKNQDPETGAWYRSAYQRRFPLSETGQPLFSRDELLGMYHYLVATKDKEAARKWLYFLKNNPKKYQTGLGKILKVHNLCVWHQDKKPDDITDKQWEDMQPDDRCELRPDSWGQMYYVMKHIGFTNSELKQIDKKMYRKMRRNRFLVKLGNYISAIGVPRYTYETALQAETVLLFREMGIGGSLVRNTAKRINKKTGYMSPLYHFLEKGKATEYGAYLIKKYCPTERPNYAHPPQGGIGVAAGSYFTSAVHWFDGLKDNWQANLPTGHECIGWINIYLNSL